jgi:stage V sporulation protein SpoVS
MCAINCLRPAAKMHMNAPPIDRQVRLKPPKLWRIKRRTGLPSQKKRRGGFVAGVDNAFGMPDPAIPVRFVARNDNLVALYNVKGDAVPSDSISDHGGARILDGVLELIFWGAAWQTATGPSRADIVQAVQAMIAGPYLSELSQYGFRSLVLRGTTIVLEPKPPKTDEVGKMVWNAIDSGVFPEPDDPGGRIIYMVLMPSGTSLPADGSRGAHSDPSDFDFPVDFERAWVGWVGPGTLDHTMDVLSHELVESITDPEPDSPAWRMNREIHKGWEIGDACNETVDRVNGLLLQAYWSERDKACVIPFAKARTMNSMATARTPNHLDVFWVGSDGAISSAWWDSSLNFGKWNVPFPITPPGAAVARAIACVARTQDHVDVFWVGSDGAISSAWWDGNVNDGKWNAPFGIAPAGAAVAGAIACIARTQNHVDVFWVGPDGSVNSAWWDGNVNDGKWNAPFGIAPPGAAVAGAIACIARTQNHMDVFWVGPDGSVNSAWWDGNVNDGKWNPSFAITEPSAAAAGAISAVSRTPNHLDVFWIAADGSVGSAWWDGNANDSKWNPPFGITPPSMAAAGAIGAVSRTPNHVDVFWVGADGSVGSVWWDGAANEGKWNAPFSIAPPGAAG